MSARTLEKTLQIVQNGWCQAPYSRIGDRFCLLAAYAEAFRLSLPENFTRYPVEYAEGWKVISDYTRKIYGISPIEYNDTEGRTQGEIVDLLQNILKSEGHHE